jgi:hypothetical protein
LYYISININFKPPPSISTDKLSEQEEDTEDVLEINEENDDDIHDQQQEESNEIAIYKENEEDIEEDEDVEINSESEEEKEEPIVMTAELSSILDKLNKRKEYREEDEEDIVIIDPDDVDSDLEDYLHNEKEEAEVYKEEEKEEESTLPAPLPIINKPSTSLKQNINTTPTTSNVLPVTKRKNRLGQNARKK